MVCQAEDYQRTLKLSCKRLAFTSYKAFLKKKKSGTSLPTSFSASFFEEKYFYFYFLSLDQISAFVCLREILRNMCNCLLTRC